MVQHLIVPVDGSPESWRAFDVAVALARRSGGDVHVVEVACDPVDKRYADERLHRELQERGPFDVDVTVEVRLSSEYVADELMVAVSLRPDSILVMSSHGKGRSAAVVGSVTEDVLQRAFGPVVLVGPKTEVGDFAGPIVVSVDGSQESEIALPLAAAWAAQLGTTPWVVNVAPETNTVAVVEDGDVFETAYTSRLASGLAAFSGHAVEFDELHDRHPGRAVPDYAARHGASMIVASSHGRGGLSRLVFGSVTADFVRRATCPVTVVRLPHPTRAHTREHMWAY